MKAVSPLPLCFCTLKLPLTRSISVTSFVSVKKWIKMVTFQIK
uniref:Uncharacterized protein n=1 Tax=Anguilla anguilla TaxID=7936 RepID=A0A0E9S606_ANGAN